MYFQCFLAEAAAAPEQIENFVPPDASDLKTFDGYKNVAFEAGEFLPPPPPTYDEAQNIPDMDFGQYVCNCLHHQNYTVFIQCKVLLMWRDVN